MRLVACLRSIRIATLWTLLSKSLQVLASYDESEALVYAYLATAAYCGYPKTSQASLESWNCGPACDKVPGITHVRQIITSDRNDAYAFVAKRHGSCILAFRGTSDFAGWMQDAKSYRLVNMSSHGIPCSHDGLDCLVGNGFIATYISLAAFIKGNLSAIGCLPGDAITVTGHSLGAAEAILAMFDLANEGYKVQHSYTFGQPRVGDTTFAAAFYSRIGSIYRVTFRRDPVVHLPFERRSVQRPGFVHISDEVFYNGPVSEGYQFCSRVALGFEDQNCSDRYGDVVGLLGSCLINIKECDHLHYMTNAKLILMDGFSCTDNSSVRDVIIA